MHIGVGQGTCKKSRVFPARAYTTLVVLVLYMFVTRSSVDSLAQLVSQSVALLAKLVLFIQYHCE